MIVVTGSNGQLGKALHSAGFNKADIIYTNRAELDISTESSVENFFKNNKNISHVINTAAYTAVDKAELEESQALLANTLGLYHLTKYADPSTQIIHVSTDFVFDGEKRDPYLYNDPTNPLNAYGRSKLAGEQLLLHYRPDSLVVRTSWVYSKDGRNFLTTMQRLMLERGKVSVVNDQVGLPTNAQDLAKALFKMTKATGKSGIYHFSNTGDGISWYQFAETIRDLSNFTAEVAGIPSSDYPQQAKRPKYSVLGQHVLKNIYQDFDIEPKNWRESLKDELT